MLPDDIEYLFDLVPLGTPVRVVNINHKVYKNKNLMDLSLNIE